MRRGKERKVEREGEALDFVNQFLLARAAPPAGQAAQPLCLLLKRSEKEKRRDRERRQRQLQGGSDEDEEDEEEEERSDVSAMEEDEDEEEAAERRSRQQQREQRRQQRNEARQLRRQQRRAQRDALTVDDTQTFLSSLTIAEPPLQQAEESKRSDDGNVGQQQEAEAAERRRHEMGEPLLSAQAGQVAAAVMDAPLAPALNFCYYGVEQEDWEQRIDWQHSSRREDDDSEQRTWKERSRQRRISALREEEAVISTSSSASASSSATAPQPLSFSTFTLPSLSSPLSSSSSSFSSSRPAVRLQWLKQASAADKQRWEQHVNAQRRQRMLERLASAASSAALRNEWRGLQLTPAVAPPTAAVERSAASELPRRLNPSLLSAEWEAAIVWDESVLLQRRELLRQHHALLLDQNDGQLLLPSARSLLHLPPPAAASLPWARQRALYDVSQDAHYALDDFRSSVSHLQRSSHAGFAVSLDPAVYRTRTRAELEQHHRPLLSIADTAPLPVLPADASASMVLDDATARYVPSTLEDMSGAEGELLLLEYLERFPPLLLAAGMASAVVTYYVKKDDGDNHQPQAKDGDVVVLRHKKDESPFLSELRPGQQVTALNNALFIAPIAQHTPPANTFLLIRATGGGSSWSVRPLPHCYIVGQQEPKLLIPPPGSAAAQELLRKQIEAWVWRRLRDSLREAAAGRVARLLLSDVQSEFGNDSVVEALAKRVLRDSASLHNAALQEYALRDDAALPSEEKLAAICTPEDVCVYDSMLAADHRLKAERGIRQFTSARQISGIIDHLTEPDVSRRACYIEKQLHLTPWSLTSGLFAHRSGKSRMLLHGRGNPFADGCGVSFISLKDIKSGEDESAAVVSEPKKKTGTNADLRKLTMEEMATALVRLGMGEEEVKALPRWDRVRAMARLSKQAAEEGQFPNLSRFARQSRQSTAEKDASFKQQLQQIFERQLQMLRSADRPDYKHEVNDDPAAVKKGDIGKQDVAALRTGKGELKKKLSTQQQKRRQEKDEEREYQDFLAERERSIKQAAAKQQQSTDSKRAAAQQAGSASSIAVHRSRRNCFQCCSSRSSNRSRLLSCRQQAQEEGAADAAAARRQGDERRRHAVHRHAAVRRRRRAEGLYAGPQRRRSQAARQIRRQHQTDAAGCRCCRGPQGSQGRRRRRRGSAA